MRNKDIDFYFFLQLNVLLLFLMNFIVLSSIPLGNFKKMQALVKIYAFLTQKFECSKSMIRLAKNIRFKHGYNMSEINFKVPDLRTDPGAVFL